MIEGLLGLAAFLLLAFLRVPMAFAMGIVGFFGFAWKVNFGAAASMIAQTTYETGLAYTLSVIPLFILMGNFVVRARMSEELYHAAYTFLGHRRGGLAMSTIVACAGFGAICGSSIATAATFAKVAYPSMRKFGYKDTLAAGSIAAGGTLGILIPPSVIMVIYGIMTETNIGKLFAAGILPGIVATVLLCLAVAWMTWRDPQAGPPGERSSWAVRREAIRHVWPVALLFLVVIGGIYLGWFSPTEGAAVGCIGALIAALLRRQLGWSALGAAVIETANTVGMVYLILIGALIFNAFLEMSGMPAWLVGLVQTMGLTPLQVVIILVIFYVIHGCFMDALSMVLLTIPVVFPLIHALQIDPVWFGILIVTVVEIGLITPPVGMNLFVIQAVGRVPQETVIRGILPFILADIVRVVLLIAFPAITLLLTRYMD